MNFVLHNCNRVIQLQVHEYKIYLWENKKPVLGILKRTLGCTVTPIIGTKKIMLSMNLLPEVPVTYDQKLGTCTVEVEGKRAKLKHVYIMGETMNPHSLILALKYPHSADLFKHVIPITKEHKDRFLTLVMT